MSYETISVQPLSPVIGAEISGVDLAQPLGNQAFAAGWGEGHKAAAELNPMLVIELGLQPKHAHR